MSRLWTAFAALRGILGGLLGAWLTARLWLWTTWSLDFLGSCAILILLLAGGAACLGYWLLRGLRNGRFARWTTCLCTVLGAGAAVVQELGGQYALALAVGLAAAPSAVLCQNTLLRYSDPIWYANPKRTACVRAGNSLYNCRLYDADQPPLPPSFQVGGTGMLIHVSGMTIRVEHFFRKGYTFSVDEVKGVIVGPPNGSNVLYDREFRALAKFGASQPNGRLFVQYLEHWEIPFYDYRNSVPLILEQEQEAAVETPPAPAPAPESAQAPPLYRPDSSLPNYFSLPLRLPTPTASICIIAAGFILSFTAFAAIPVLVGSFAAPSQVSFLMTYVWGPVSLVLMVGPIAVLTLTGRLLPAELEVDDGRIYQLGFFLNRRELTGQIAAFLQDRSDTCWVLLDHRNRPIVKFSGDTLEASMLLKYLREQNIPWLRDESQERN